MATTRRPLFYISIVILAAAALFALYAWFTLSWSYSTGERAGYLQKFSQRGWLCKTWEGEILMATMPGAIPERFPFTVRDDAVARQLSAAIGQRVVLTYAQHKGIPTTCFGDTEYFVEKVVLATGQPQVWGPSPQGTVP
ncbi:MAG TPA: hypothetical protein VFT37_06895 [Telluria sp.]|nr:hypothetical protein [Telluria sp.]